MSEITVKKAEPAIESVTLELTADEARAVSRVLNGGAESVFTARIAAAEESDDYYAIYIVARDLRHALA